MSEQDNETAASKAYSVLTLLYHRGMIRATRPQSADEDRVQTEQVRQLVWDAIVACERETHAIAPQPAPDAAVTEAAVRAARGAADNVLRQGLEPLAEERLTLIWMAYASRIRRTFEAAFLPEFYRLFDAGASEVRE